ncbi:1,4-dihydroxy-2-naphthoate polyprenyltransferase [Petrocella sp. FN5]|uniref:1,4-dihydroxy-2-naphthoate polyprenyltransferase n=1 Tax=Petrocella sp. FN5 TaxID=3032002 RepID=UPI0023D9F6F6|nr:1,4-dihydroxy-2-naphthoate polyprenyltransferase [Petrocella sp. FN5]MDF1616275.1 1,4-dihydroxy-2-naphthoate polyprenyltransferase [Petrocella sp. FN5]
MKISSFFKLVEIQTKVASVLPFLTGVAFCYYRYREFDLLRLGLFFLSMLCVDMATTTINNYWDYKKAILKEGFNYESHNAIVRDRLTEKQVILTIGILLVIGALFGFALFLLTDWVVLVIGILAFGVGVLYSYGPIPISHTPLGEVVSGTMMGGLIFFITNYIQIFERGYINYYMEYMTFHLAINMKEIIIIIFIAAPLIFLIANIMLANNICDMEDDLINRRYTLPAYIGKNNAIHLFVLLVGLSYFSMLIGIIMKWLPISTLLVFLTIFPVYKGVKEFLKEQNKAKTFVVSVKNFVVISGSYVASIFLSIIVSMLA